MPADIKPDTRTRILEAAYSLLSRHGVGELSQPKVARAAGLRQSHLTYYFPTRSDLLQALAQHSIGLMLARLTGEATRGSLTPERLALLVGNMVSDKRRARTMLGLIVTSDEHREIKQFLRDFVVQVRGGIAGLAQMLGKDVDPERVAAFHALMVGTAILNVARDNAKSRKDCAQLARFAVEHILFDSKAPAPAPQGHPGMKRK
jgi:AcrR family transcriptional regulator